MYPVNLLVITLNGIELQPRYAAHLVGSRARVLWRSALDDVGERLYVAVVGSFSAHVEHGDLLVREVVVARQALCGFRARGDGVVERESGYVGHDAVVEARGVTCCVEEGGDGAGGDGRGVGGGRGAGVVLGAAADGDVSECVAFADCWERCGCWWRVSFDGRVEGKRRNVPTGRRTLDKSHSPLVFFNSSTTALGKSCRGISCAIESAT